MKLKIEEIEKLNAERTQGKWDASPLDKDDRDAYCVDVASNRTNICLGTHFNEDGILEHIPKCCATFIAAAPTITEQYIKARRFEVTEDIIKEAHTKQNGGWKTIYFQGHDFKNDIGFARAILETMWEEIENA